MQKKVRNLYRQGDKQEAFSAKQERLLCFPASLDLLQLGGRRGKQKAGFEPQEDQSLSLNPPLPLEKQSKAEVIEQHHN